MQTRALKQVITHGLGHQIKSRQGGRNVRTFVHPDKAETGESRKILKPKKILRQQSIPSNCASTKQITIRDSKSELDN